MKIEGSHTFRTSQERDWDLFTNPPALEEAPSELNPLGVKGAGEGGIVGTGAALANAVVSALQPLGVEVRDLPLSPDRIRAWIRHRSARPSV